MNTAKSLQSHSVSEPYKGALPEGVEIIPFTTHRDQRGELTEIFRQSALTKFNACQWNMVRSEANVLRGVHVHQRHSDFLVLATGRCAYGLYDCRPESPTSSSAALVEADESCPFGLLIPPGVAHGFYFFEASLHIYAVTHYWDPNDELGFRFDDPELGIKWPTNDVILSARDQNAPPLSEVRKLIESWIPAHSLPLAK